jgi:ABC-2 type transport system ATP-binding protein
MVKITNFKKSYGDTTVLSIPRVELPHNIYWLKGENGSGKTTLIRSMAGLIPFDGEIVVGNADIRRQRIEYRSKVNYAEAEPQYPAFVTGNDLMQFYAETKKAQPQQVAELKNYFGIDSFSGNKVGTYSSGMMKKLSLVLGFIGNPELILLDEPLITLDQQSVTRLQQLIEDHYNSGTTFIITSHQEISFTAASPSRLLVDHKTITTL